MDKRLGITDEEIRKIAEHLIYTCNEIDGTLYRFEYESFDVSDVEDRLLDINIERCPICGWWCESTLFIEIEIETGKYACDSCVPYYNEVYNEDENNG